MKAREIYERTLDSIVAALEKGEKPWVTAWQPSLPRNLSTKMPYRGMNILNLWESAGVNGYEHQAWLTLKQANTLGGKIRKGESATQCFFWKKPDTAEVPVGKEKVRKTWFPVAFSLFNIAQIDGLPEEILPEAQDGVLTKDDRLAEAGRKVDELVRAHGVVIQTGGVQAAFIPSLDIIQMPPAQDFTSVENYYAVLLHELTHWSGAQGRLNREMSTDYGSPEYAFEEFVAELGSAFSCARLGIPGTLERHTCYINRWLELAREDKRALGRAARLASEAHEYLVSKLDVPAEATPQEAA